VVVDERQHGDLGEAVLPYSLGLLKIRHRKGDIVDSSSDRGEIYDVFVLPG
jgi:hypothetical protein